MAQEIHRHGPDWPLAIGPAAFLGVASYFLTRSPLARVGFPLDDAWIHRVYAKAFSSGAFFAYNDGGEQVTGSSSPLWAILTAPAHWFGAFGEHVPVFAVKLAGIAAAGLAIYCLGRICRALGLPSVAVAVAAVVFALAPRLSFAALSGMEDVVLLALWLAATERALARSWSMAALLAGLGAAVRPEGALLLAVVPLALRLGAADYWGQLRRPAFWVALAGPLALWMLFCLLVSGHPLPATFYIKNEGFAITQERIASLWRVATEASYAGTWLYPLGSIGLALLYRRRRPRGWRPVALLLIVAPLLYLAGVASTRSIRPDGYYWLRYVDGALLALNAMVAVGLGYCIELSVGLVRGLARLEEAQRSSRKPARAGRRKDRRRGRAKGKDSTAGEPRLAGYVAAAVTAVALLATPSWWKRLDERRERLTSDTSVVQRVNVAAGEWLAKHAAAGASVAVSDAGAIRYFGKRRTIDLRGLNEPTIAFGGKTAAERVRELRVDFLIGFPDDMTGKLGATVREFQLVKVLDVPAEEYTICDCGGQVLQAVLKRPGVVLSAAQAPMQP